MRSFHVTRHCYGDIESAVEYYQAQAGDAVADRFLRALEEALDHVGTHPQTGSAEWASDLQLPGLRHWPLQRFPYLLFYVAHGDEVRVWRLLHARRDIASALDAPE